MKITITGVPPYDGEYPFDMARLTNRDIHTIKQITGYMPLEYEAAAERGDTDFVVALGVIAVQRSARFQKVDVDLFWDAEVGKIQVEEAEEVEDDPPLNAPETPISRSGAPGTSDGVLHQVRSLASTGTDSSAT